MIRKLTFIAATLAALATLVAASDADAQRRRGPRFSQGRAIDGVRIDVHGTLAWYGGLGGGLRVDIPIVPNGFIEGIHDELAISFGGEIFFWAWYACNRRNCGDGYWDYRHDGVAVMPLGAAQWNFYLNESWSLFPELGFAAWLFWHDHDGGGPDDTHGHFRASPLISFGARWHFTERNALLFRATWPVGFQFGITF